MIQYWNIFLTSNFFIISLSPVLCKVTLFLASLLITHYLSDTCNYYIIHDIDCFMTCNYYVFSTVAKRTCDNSSINNNIDRLIPKKAFKRTNQEHESSQLSKYVFYSIISSVVEFFQFGVIRNIEYTFLCCWVTYSCRVLNERLSRAKCLWR